MKKKLLAVLLTATMVLGMGITANAEEPVYDTAAGDKTDLVSNGKIDFNSSVETAEISVTISKAGDVILNPYKLEIDLDGEDGEETSDDSFIGTTITFINKSNVPIKVGVTGKIALPSYDGVAAADKVTVGANVAAVEKATSKMVAVQAVIEGFTYTDIDDAETYTSVGKLQSKTSKTSGGVTTDTYTDVLPLNYSVAGAKITNAPVLAVASGSKELKAVDATAKKSAINSVEIINIVISGATSISPSSEWDDDADRIVVTTLYDLSIAKNADISGFGSTTE